MGIEPTHELITRALVLKTRRPTRRLGTSIVNNVLDVYIFVNLLISEVSRDMVVKLCFAAISVMEHKE